MPRGVDEVERVFCSVEFVVHLDGVAFDCYASFLFQVHVVEHLALCDFDCSGVFQKAVCQCRFTVVDMCYYTKIAYSVHKFIEFTCKNTKYYDNNRYKLLKNSYFCRKPTTIF